MTTADRGRAEAATLSNIVVGLTDARLVLNDYGVPGLGVFNLTTPGGTLRALCVQANIAHSTSANYQPVAMAANWNLATLLWLSDMQTSNPDTAAALEALSWYYTGAVRTIGLAVWANPTNGAPISPVSPEAWNALPGYSGAHPIGIQTIGGAAHDGAEAEVYRLFGKVAALKGPWTMPNVTVDSIHRTASARVMGANGAIVGVTVTFSLPGGALVTAATDASGWATIAIPTGTPSGSVSASVTAPAPQVAWGAAGVQQVAVAGAPTTLTGTRETFAEASVVSVATDAADGDHSLFSRGGTVNVRLDYQVPAAGTYTAHVSGRVVGSGAPSGLDGSVDFSVPGPFLAGSVTVPVTVPAGWSGQQLVWFDSITDSTGFEVASHNDLADAAQTITVGTSSVSSSALDPADGDQVLPYRGGQARVTLSYTGLVPGDTYTGRVVMMLPDGTATGVEGTADFVPVAATGAVEIPVDIPIGMAGASVVFYDEIVEADGVTVTAFHRDLADPAQTLSMADTPVAEVHLRKTISGDGGASWVNAQRGSEPTFTPGAAPTNPRNGSFDDAAADLGDGVPVLMAGTAVSFRYEVWLDATSTGDVTFDGSTDGVVTDDNGTPLDSVDDWQPVYVSGDDGDDVLSPGEIWVYEAISRRIAAAGERYTNFASIPAGMVVDRDQPATPTGIPTTPRLDRAGYIVPSCSTAVSNDDDGSQVLGLDGGVLIDTVTCSNLPVGESVEVTGSLHSLNDDGSVSPVGIAGRTFTTPNASDVELIVEFAVPDSLAPGAYVAFEQVRAADRLVAEHADPTSTTQSFRKRSPLTISTVACKAEVVLATGATRGNQCDILTIGGDPGDQVSGLITAYPVVDGVRQCSQPAGAAEWSATVGDSGSVTVTSPGVDLPAGNYEWIEEAWTADGRTGGSRDCLTSPRVAAESFKMSPSKGTPGKGIPATGVDSWLMMECSLGVLGIGVAMARAGHRTRAVMRR